MTNTDKNVFIYMSYSSTMQNYLSIEAQRRAITVFCNENNFNIIAEYIDEAQSATNDKREQFQQMISDTKKIKPYAVIVHKLDRFSRNRYDSVIYKSVLEKNRVKLISILEPFDDTPESKMMEGIVSTMNEYYSNNLAREVEKGKKEIAYKCYHTGGLPPYGYDVGADRKYVLNEQESKAVKKIFTMYINDYSYQDIADYLNKNGYRTKKGQPFKRNSFSSILENAEKYKGVFIYNRALSKYSDGTRNSHKHKSDNEIIKIKDGMPRIISDDMYDKVMSKMHKAKQNAKQFHSKRYYLLNGLIHCKLCDKTYSGNTSYSGRNKSEYSTYRCSNYRNGCVNKDININYINNFVVDILSDEIFSPKNYNRILSILNTKYNNLRQNNKYEIIKLKNEILQIDFKLNKFIDILIEKDDSETLHLKIDNLEKEKEMLSKKISILQEKKYLPITEYDIDIAKNNFRYYVLNCDYPIFRTFIREFIYSIDVYDDRIEVIMKTSNY